MVQVESLLPLPVSPGVRVEWEDSTIRSLLASLALVVVEKTAVRVAACCTSALPRSCGSASRVLSLHVAAMPQTAARVAKRLPAVPVVGDVPVGEVPVGEVPVGEPPS